MTNVSTVASERVQAGATWLDGEVPGWQNMIDIRTLEMDDADNCILGQLHFWYDEDDMSTISWKSAVSRGFGTEFRGHGDVVSYAELHTEWVNLIERRTNREVSA